MVRLFLCSLVLLIGCAQAPTLTTDNTAPDYLRGVDSAYSVRLSELGDTDLLGAESSMQNALVGGDEELFVAASAYRSGDIFGVDLVLVNHSGAPVVFERGDLHLVDAEGRWLEPLSDWAGGARHGLRAGATASASTPVVEVPDRDSEFDSFHTLNEIDPSATSTATRPRKTSALDRDRRRPDDDRQRFDSNSEDVGDGLAGALRAVRVPDGEGRVFWGYFEAVAPAFPITAVVMIDGEQIVYRFDR